MVDTPCLVAEGVGAKHRVASRLFDVDGDAVTPSYLISKLAVDGRPALEAWAWRHGVAR